MQYDLMALVDQQLGRHATEPIGGSGDEDSSHRWRLYEFGREGYPPAQASKAGGRTRLAGVLTLTQTPKCHIILDKRDGITAWHLTDVYWPEWGFSWRLSRAAASRVLLGH